MIKFDLEKALAGDKVVTRDGREASSLTFFNTNSGAESLASVIDGKISTSHKDGKAFNVDTDSTFDLFMAPKKLSGFVNVYSDDGGELFFGDVSDDKLMSKQLSNISNHEIVARIDLSHFEEGHWLLTSTIKSA